MKPLLILLMVASPAFGSPISGPSGFLTLPEARAMAQAGALMWTSDREFVGAFYFDPLAGRAPTIHTPWSVLTVGDDNRASVARDAFDAMTCGRVQIDLEQYGASGLDYSTLLVLFVDSGIDCGTTGTPAPQSFPREPGTIDPRSVTPVPEPGTLVLLGSCLFIAARKRFSR